MDFPSPLLVRLGGVAVIAFAATLLLTYLVRVTVARTMLDVPNERSSHSTVVPRGGGLAIVVVTVSAMLWMGHANSLGWKTALALSGGGATIALVGWIDDRSSLSPLLRLFVHFAAAIWTVGWLGGLPTLEVGDGTITLHLAGSMLAVLAIVWSTNLFNFMDGIDGLAGIEAAAVGGISGCLLAGSGAFGLGATAIAAGAAALGFLYWNWHPARIFMGDVGSSFLGYLFASIAVGSENLHAVPALVWIILAAAFIIDATVTLLRRARHGYVSEPHRTHAYQRAVQAGMSHAHVSLAVGVVNAILGALALTVYLRPQLLLIGVVAALAIAAVGYTLVGRFTPFPDLRRSRPLKP